MSREIKFRAFIDGEMVFLPFAGLQYFDFEGSYALSFAVDGYSGFWAHECYESQSKKIKDSPIMQYTGLKDKNGKEIYEGDIIRIVTNSWTRNAPVEFDEELAMFRIAFKEDFLYQRDLYAWNESAKVIGNIYQNPELISIPAGSN